MGFMERVSNKYTSFLEKALFCAFIYTLFIGAAIIWVFFIHDNQESLFFSKAMVLASFIEGVIGIGALLVHMLERAFQVNRVHQEVCQSPSVGDQEAQVVRARASLANVLPEVHLNEQSPL